MRALDRMELERLRFQQGQMLRSRDFRDQKRIEEQLRWWHNRALHGAYGIAGGLEAAFADRAVAVSSGVAYDCFGRELIVPHALGVPLPSLEAGVTPLVLRYPGELSWVAGEEAVPVAVLSAVALATLPAGTKLPASVRYDATLKLLVALGPLSAAAEATLLAISNDAAFTKAVRDLAALSRRAPSVPSARPLARPRIGYGTTIPGSTQWELWIDDTQGAPVFLGFQAAVDTSAAGFTKVPCYFASLATMVTPFEHIEDTSIDGFKFRVLVGPLGRVIESGFAAQLLAIVRALNISICWIGIQHEPGPQFVFSEPEVNHGCA
jgi:hypothetical protein